MVEQSFWEMLRTKRDSLTKSGIIVADYLLQHKFYQQSSTIINNHHHITNPSTDTLNLNCTHI